MLCCTEEECVGVSSWWLACWALLEGLSLPVKVVEQSAEIGDLSVDRSDAFSRMAEPWPCRLAATVEVLVVSMLCKLFSRSPDDGLEES